MIIVLCGVAGSGKDTIGDLLAANHGFRREAFATPLKQMAKLAFPAFTDEDLYGPSRLRSRQYKQYRFSSMCPTCGKQCDPIMLTSDPPVHEGWYCPRCKINYDNYVSPRFALQTLGTEWGRRLYPNVWIDGAFQRIREVARPAYDTLGKHMIDPATSKEVTFDKFAFSANWVITDGRFNNEIARSRELGAMIVKLTRGLSESKDPHASEAEFRSIPDHAFDYIFGNYALEELPLKVHNMHTALSMNLASSRSLGGQ